MFDLPVQPNVFFDIALDAAGRLLVVDPSNHRILKFDISSAQPALLGWLGGCSGGSRCVKPAGSTIGHTQGSCKGAVAQCGNPVLGTIAGAFERPFYVATDPAGDFYIADLIQGVQHFNAAAAVVATLPRGVNVGQTGSGHIFVASNGDLYVADTANNRVNRFSRAGALLAVVGGGLGISVLPGDADFNRLTLTEQTPSQVAVVMVSSLGYTGPVTLTATSCLRETASPPYVPCTSYGISTQFSKTALTLTAGGVDTAALTVSATTATPGRTLNGRYLVAVAAVDGSGNLIATGQLAIMVSLADKFGIVADSGQLHLFPGDTGTVQLKLANLSGVTGHVDPNIGIAPAQAPGHLSYTYAPHFVATTAFAAAPTIPLLQIKLNEKARSGNPNVNIFAKRGNTQIGSTTIDLQIDCNCRSTGAFVEPELLAVKPSTTNPLSGTSPSGTFTVNTGVIQSGAGPIPWVEIPGRVGQVSNAAAWGFSPNDKYFLVATLNASIPNLTTLSVFDLAAQNKQVQNITITGCMMPNDPACMPPPSFCYGGADCLSPTGTKANLNSGYASWGFRPDDKTLLVAQLNVGVYPPREYSLAAYDLGHANSTPMLNQQFMGGNAFWRFSPCGDMIMHFEQRAVGSAIERDARFWALDGGHTPVSRLLATATYTGSTNGGGALAASIAPASSVADGSNGAFDVVLSNLAAQGSARTDGFQSLQCRARWGMHGACSRNDQMHRRSMSWGDGLSKRGPFRLDRAKPCMPGCRPFITL